jgi:hypothetical protein
VRQRVVRKRSPPIALAARDKYGLALFVGEPIERLLDCEIGAALSLSAPGLTPKADMPYSRRQVFANAAIAASRVSA